MSSSLPGVSSSSLPVAVVAPALASSPAGTAAARIATRGAAARRGLTLSRLPRSPFGLPSGHALQARFERRAARCPVGWQPAGALRHLHDAVWVSGLWQRLCRTAADPVRVSGHGRRRCVQVLGVMRLQGLEQPPEEGVRLKVWAPVAGRSLQEAAENRQYEYELMRALEVDAAGAAAFRQEQDGPDAHPSLMAWQHLSAERLVLGPSMNDEGWLVAVRRACEFELTQRLIRLDRPFKTAELHAYLDQLFAHLRRRLGRERRLVGLVARVLEGLQLDATALNRARRFIRVDGEVHPSLADYVTAVRLRPALDRLEREQPQLLPVFALAADDPDTPYRPGDEPAHFLRRWFTANGLLPRTWRLVLRSGPRLLMPLRHFYSGYPVSALLDFLLTLQDLDTREAPSPWFLWVALSAVANPGYRFNRHRQDIPCRNQWALALRHHNRLPETQRNRDEVACVLRWMFRALPVFDQRQRDAGWSWLLQRAHDWEQCEAARLRTSQGMVWQAPDERADVGPPVRSSFLLQPVTTALDLWLEGQAMRHCIADRLSSCRLGKHHVLSLRPAGEPDRRLATVLLCNDGTRWTVEGVRGFANRDASPAMWTAAAAHAERLDPRRPAERPHPYAAEPGTRIRDLSPYIEPAASIDTLDTPDLPDTDGVDPQALPGKA